MAKPHRPVPKNPVLSIACAQWRHFDCASEFCECACHGEPLPPLDDKRLP